MQGRAFLVGKTNWFLQGLMPTNTGFRGIKHVVGYGNERICLFCDKQIAGVIKCLYHTETVLSLFYMKFLNPRSSVPGSKVHGATS